MDQRGNGGDFMDQRGNGGAGAVVLTITLMLDGKLNVTGPIENEILAFGMLASAEHAIREHNKRKAEGPRVVPVPASALRAS